jgi:integrase
VLRSSLNAAKANFSTVELRQLERQAPEIAAWRATLKPGSRVGATKALRQCLDQAIKWGVIAQNPARLAGTKLTLLSDELGPQGAAMVRVAAETGMRPCEWLALEWKDVKREKRRVVVERTFSRGVLRPYGKTDRSRRQVPLTRVASEALATLPRRIDTPLIFLSERGEIQHLENWCPREWKPALKAAGIAHGNIYTLRHTAITNMLAADISLHDVARIAGTSVVQVSKTYGHLAEGAEDAALAKLDAAAGGLGV